VEQIVEIFSINYADVSVVAWSPDNRTFAFGCGEDLGAQDPMFAVWDLEAEEELSVYVLINLSVVGRHF